MEKSELALAFLDITKAKGENHKEEFQYWQASVYQISGQLTKIPCFAFQISDEQVAWQADPT